MFTIYDDNNVLMRIYLTAELLYYADLNIS